MNEAPYPIEIRRLPAARHLRIAWSDGHFAEYGYDYLRAYCPCAGCQGHGTNKIRYQEPPAPVEPVSIQPVGNYAISFHWSDAHASGIYRFEFLREICPCPQCAEEGEFPS